jgi:hypothetical protein
MASIDTFHKRLRDEIATVEQEIQSHNEQVEALTKRLEGLKRADELFDSDQAAMAELLQAGVADGSGPTQERAAAPAVKVQKAATGPKATVARQQVGRQTEMGRGKTKPGPNARAVSRNGGLTRVDMIAAVLRRHRRLTVRELTLKRKNFSPI